MSSDGEAGWPLHASPARGRDEPYRSGAIAASTIAQAAERGRPAAAINADTGTDAWHHRARRTGSRR